MADKLEALLERAGPSQALSFVVIVPGWLEDAGFRTLQASRFKRAYWLVAKEEHGFCDGAQHQRYDRYRESPFDTAFFLLQTEAAHEKWPPTPESEEGVRRAMAMAVPTEAMKLKRMKEGRGFADADGGGGVYKGKKKNKDKSKGVVFRRKQGKKTKQGGG